MKVRCRSWFRHFNFPKKSLGLLWACELTTAALSKMPSFIEKIVAKCLFPTHTPHSGKKKKREENQQLVRAELSLHVFPGHKGKMHLSHQCRLWWDHQGPCHSSSAHTEHTDCSFMKWKCPRKENVKEVSSVITFQRGERKRTGQCIWIFGTWTECNRLLWSLAFIAFSQHHWPLHFIVWRCQGKRVESIQLSTEHWLSFEISVDFCGSLPPTPLPQIPLGDV